MSFPRQTIITPDFDRVELLFDFEELSVLMNDFKGGIRNTVHVLEGYRDPFEDITDSTPSFEDVHGSGYNVNNNRYQQNNPFAEGDPVAAAVIDYDYYRGSDLWGRIAESLDIDMDSDDFNADQISEMYSFAFEQNEEYWNPTFDPIDLGLSDYAVDHDDDPDTPGVVPTRDITYQNRYTDEEKTTRHAFDGSLFKLGESMSLNYDSLYADYTPLNSSSIEDSGFNGGVNSLYNMPDKTDNSTVSEESS